jgi:diguanylate cyclase (GGDEF)-like protein
MTRPALTSVRLHMGALYLAVATLLFTVGLGVFVDHRHDALNHQGEEVALGLERILRYNQDLTQLLSSAVLERNILRASGYQTANSNLITQLELVTAQTADMAMATEVATLMEESLRLRHTEEEALRAMRRNDWDSAQKILFGDDYLRARKLYEINSESVAVGVTGELDQTTERYEDWRDLFIVLRILSVALLLWTGAMFSRRLRAELAEQTRLRTEIAAANQALEDKVLQRTAELQAANQRLEQLSITDGLTGLANRRHFDATFEQEWQRAIRQGSPLAVLMLDVDHFKAYNDHYGHPAGDECLRQLAHILHAQVKRAGELAARYGGEEFVVLLPGVSVDLAGQTAERIRSALELLSMPHQASAVSQVVTLSVGVAVAQPQRGENPYSLLKAADEALYQAKAQGRNRVVLSSRPPSSAR